METFIDISTGETFVENLEIMARLNSTFAVKRGAVGTVLSFRLFDADKLPFTLTGLLTLTARKGRQSPVIEDAPCNAGNNQQFGSTAAGLAYFKFDGEAASVPKGEYNLEFSHLDTVTGTVTKFPTSAKQPYAKLIVHDALSEE